ncbi:MAG TPA: heme transporter CcmC [Nitrososphaerales archaeon]|nr:heme transporter CcmC [Nitrososphaerales archaeon]
MNQLGAGLVSIRLLSLILAPLFLASLIPILDSAFAQEEQIINRRVEIWALFYRLMTAAFIVGAVVQGVMVFIAVRFREKKVKQEEVAQ